MNSPVLIAKHIEGNGMLQAKVVEGLVWFENLRPGILNKTGRLHAGHLWCWTCLRFPWNGGHPNCSQLHMWWRSLTALCTSNSRSAMYPDGGTLLSCCLDGIALSSRNRTFYMRLYMAWYAFWVMLWLDRHYPSIETRSATVIPSGLNFGSIGLCKRLL